MSLPLGYITCTVSYNNVTTNLDIFVVRNVTGPPILGFHFYYKFKLHITKLNYVNFPSYLNMDHIIKKYSLIFSRCSQSNWKMKMKRQNFLDHQARAIRYNWILKKDGRVRICGDFKVTLNPHIEIRYLELRNYLVNHSGGEEFSKVDLY